ncbi:MAG: hypothetical protein FWC68_00580 [Oscillospiraceae bacterium]|nr:hypothetical protein [Oscillospiraceae bacterium]
MYKIIFYEGKNGISETNKYINKLREKSYKSKDSKIKFTKISSYINMLSKHGLKLGIPYIKPLGRWNMGIKTT